MSTPDFEVGVNNDNCKHANLPTNKYIVSCQDCGQFFVVKERYIMGASNGGTTGLVYEFLPSNFLGFTCGGGFSRPVCPRTP